MVRRALGALAVVVGALLSLAAIESSAQARGPACTGFSAGAVAGRVDDPEVVELSGVVASRAHPGVLWVHNDSGGEPEVRAVSSTGEALGGYRVEGATATDWEDIGIGPGPEPGRSYLYVADIGDNGSTREHVTVYVVAEPDAAPDGADGSLPVVAELAVRYPDGPSDAEALFVDPVEGDLYVITKTFVGSPSQVLRAEAGALGTSGEVTLHDVGELEGGLIVTAADISPDGSTVLVRTYADVLAYRRPDGGPVAGAFASPPCTAPSMLEQQGEAVAFSVDGAAYLTISEGASPPIHRFAVEPPLTSTTTTSTTAPAAPPSTEPDSADGDEDDGSSAVVPIVVGLGVAAVVAAGVVWAVRRQRNR